MKKLIYSLCALGVIPSSGLTINKYQNSQSDVHKKDNYDKIALSELTFYTTTYDTKGDESISVVERVAINKMIKETENPISDDFLAHFLEKPEQYLVIGGISVLPKIGQIITFNYDVLATSDNELYSGIANFTIILVNTGVDVNDPLHVNEQIDFYESMTLTTSGWVWDSHNAKRTYKVLNWSEYANNWTEFLRIYGQGQNKHELVYNISGQAETDFYAYDSLDTDIRVSFYNITESKTDFIDANQSINLFATVGTSKVVAEFYSSVYRDDTFVYVDFNYYLGLGSFAGRYVSMSAYANGLKLEQN